MPRLAMICWWTKKIEPQWVRNSRAVDGLWYGIDLNRNTRSEA